MSTPVAPLVVLVVEDEQLLRDLVEPALADAGYSVLLAHNGSEALKYLEERGSEEAPTQGSRYGRSTGAWPKRLGDCQASARTPPRDPCGLCDRHGGGRVVL